VTGLGVGIVGCGNIAETYLRLAPLYAGFEIRAVADIDMEAARSRAEAFSVRAMDVDDLLAASDIDIVVNLTVPSAHFDVSRRALEAGKHVYSEKPLVLQLVEGEALRALAARQGLLVGSAPDTFLGGAHQAARHLIDQGGVGRITGGTCHVMGGGMEAWHPNPDFFFQPGGGPILDMGPYYVTNLIQLLGPVARVAAIGGRGFAERTIGSGPRAGDTVPVATPTTLHALLSFESGASVTLSASWDVRAHRHGPMELYGTGGTVYLPDPNFFGGVAETDRGGGPVPVSDAGHPFAVANETHGDRLQANYRGAGLADMATAIVEGRPHRCGLDMALHAVDVMTGILRSAEAGTFVAMTTTCTRPAPLSADEAARLLTANRQG
jgi:predicted dehydrogenase